MTKLLSAVSTPNHSIADFAEVYQSLTRNLRNRSVPIASSRYAPALELSGIGDASQFEMQRLAGTDKIERIEDDPIVGRKVSQGSGPSQIAHVLDGVQYTHSPFYVEHVPVYLTISIAAILHRSPQGEVGIFPGSLRVFQSWIMPTRRLSGNVAGVYEALMSLQQPILDPLAEFDQPEVYHRNYLDMGQIARLSLEAAKNARGRMERELLGWWDQHPKKSGWIIVDGTLQEPVKNAVGLVKSFLYQHLTGSESVELFGLPEGYRTSAFVPVRSGEKTLWYLRMRSAEGHDPRYGLVRLEVAGQRNDPELFNQLSWWILKERNPRATSDERSDTLVYPIHLLERMLKRHVISKTRDWPGGRKG